MQPHFLASGAVEHLLWSQNLAAPVVKGTAYFTDPRSSVSFRRELVMCNPQTHLSQFLSCNHERGSDRSTPSTCPSCSSCKFACQDSAFIVDTNLQPAHCAIEDQDAREEACSDMQQPPSLKRLTTTVTHPLGAVDLMTINETSAHFVASPAYLGRCCQPGCYQPMKRSKKRVAATALAAQRTEPFGLPGHGFTESPLMQR
jgi:hypothetical protein